MLVAVTLHEAMSFYDNCNAVKFRLAPMALRVRLLKMAKFGAMYINRFDKGSNSGSRRVADPGFPTGRRVGILLFSRNLLKTA